jgi:hypothetical protein
MMREMEIFDINSIILEENISMVIKAAWDGHSHE